MGCMSQEEWKTMKIKDEAREFFRLEKNEDETNSEALERVVAQARLYQDDDEEELKLWCDFCNRQDDPETVQSHDDKTPRLICDDCVNEGDNA